MKCCRDELKEFFNICSKKMNEIFKNYSFVKTYIDDVMMYNNTLEKHLRYLNIILDFFKNEK